jgi:uncharacterized protein (TIGR00288 family)
MPDVSSLAVLVDFENLALGFQDRHDRFDIQRVLQRLVEKGKIISKKAYADWSRYADYKRALHEAGLELIEIPRRAMTGKNSADIHLVVDAMDLSYSKEHIDTFVIVSGDSDFSPLVAKLKENGKRVLGLAMRNSTSDLLVSACDEFIFYEDLETENIPQTVELENVVPSEKRKVFRLLLETLTALQREVSGPILASMIKDTIRRKQPSFNESGYGYGSFSALLEDAQASGLLKLSTDSRSGTYTVIEFHTPAPRGARRGRRRPPRGDATSESGTRSVSARKTPARAKRSAAGTAPPTPKTATDGADNPRRGRRKSTNGRRRRARSHDNVPGL